MKSREATKPLRRKILFIAFDAASWNIVDPLVREGRMPNMTRLMEDGVSCVCRSFEPVSSPILWTSVASGKLPDKHGIKDFVSDSRALRCKRLWEILEMRGFSVGLMGHMVTWPPQAVNGFIVPDLLAPGIETYPSELEFIREIIMSEKMKARHGRAGFVRNVHRALRHGLRPATVARIARFFYGRTFRRFEKREMFYQTRVLKQEIMSDFFVFLYRKYSPDFGFFHTHLVDSASHNFWKFMEWEKFDGVGEKDIRKYGNVIFHAYQEVDRVIGKILKEVNEEETIIVVASDHGAKANESTTPRRPCLLRTENILEKLDLSGKVHASNINMGILFRLIDEGPERERELISILDRTIVVESGLTLFETNKLRYNNLYIELNRNVDDISSGNVRVGEKIFPIAEFIQASDDKLSGAHDRENALLVIKGNGIRKGKRLSSVSILDTVPTLLALLNRPVAKDLDGHVLMELIEEDFLAKYPLRFIDTYEDEGGEIRAGAEPTVPEEVREQLRSLEYLN